MSRGVWVKDRQLALWGGVAAVVVGSLLLHDAFEHRGKTKPWIYRLLPGV